MIKWVSVLLFLNEEKEEDYLEESSEDDGNVSFKYTIVFNGSPTSIQEVEEDTEIKCPAWYSRLNQNQKKHIKNLIGEASSSTKDLENLLMNECGTDRKDAQDLLIWWFSRQQKKELRIFK